MPVGSPKTFGVHSTETGSVEKWKTSRIWLSSCENVACELLENYSRPQAILVGDRIVEEGTSVTCVWDTHKFMLGCVKCGKDFWVHHTSFSH